MDGTSARAVLGLSVDASRQDIKTAFRVRARRVHPDRGGDNAAFRVVHTAYEVALRDARPPVLSHPFLPAMVATAPAVRPPVARSFAEELHRHMAH